MRQDDKQFEKYLHEFEPRRPGTLRDTQGSWPLWRRFAAAAVIFVVIGASAWVARRPQEAKDGQFVPPTLVPAKSDQGQVTLGELRRLEDQPEQLEGVLANASHRELPDFREKDSALRFLAKE